MPESNQNLSIADIKKAIETGGVSASELRELLAAYPSKKAEVEPKKSNVGQILSYIGSGFVLLGVSFIISIYWESYDSWLKVAVTLGSGLIFWLMSVLFLNTKLDHSVSLSAYLVGMILTTTGVVVLISDVLKPEQSLAPLYLAIGYLFIAALQGIQILLQRHWANILFGYFHYLVAVWLLYTYFVGKFDITTTTTMYILFGITGITLLSGSSIIKFTFVHVSRLLQIFGTMLIAATAFGVATEYKWFYGFVMALTLLLGLVWGIYKKLLIMIGITIFWLFIYVQWLNVQYFQSQVTWGQSLIVLGLVCIGLYQLSKSHKLTKIPFKFGKA
jgi:Predicted membrane protein (DUF2157)